nr:hypothetical protein Iba_chr03aCG14180 [Ipomoea batatas]
MVSASLIRSSWRINLELANELLVPGAQHHQHAPSAFNCYPPLIVRRNIVSPEASNRPIEEVTKNCVLRLEDFSPLNKIGRMRVWCCLYKGGWRDGTLAAIKVEEMWMIRRYRKPECEAKGETYRERDEIRTHVSAQCGKDVHRQRSLTPGVKASTSQVPFSTEATVNFAPALRKGSTRETNFAIVNPVVKPLNKKKQGLRMAQDRWGANGYKADKKPQQPKRIP